jgi:hypothetical protein
MGEEFRPAIHQTSHPARKSSVATAMAANNTSLRHYLSNRWEAAPDNNSWCVTCDAPRALFGVSVTSAEPLLGAAEQG